MLKWYASDHWEIMNSLDIFGALEGIIYINSIKSCSNKKTLKKKT